MIKRITPVFITCILISSALQAGDLQKEFASPPDSARMWTWWFWLGDKVDKESITADLEALKAQGVAGVTVYSLSGPGVNTKGPNYMSPEWRELFKHTVKEADRLGLGVSAMLCSGWNAGGPWIKPEQACKKHTFSELVIAGPQHFSGKLPHPQADPRFYRDVAVQAFPVSLPASTVKISASSSHPSYQVGNTSDGNGSSFWVSNGENPNEGPSQAKPEWLLVDLGEGPTARKLTIQPRPGFGPKDTEVQYSADGSAFTTLKTLAVEKDKSADIELPNTPARYWRLFITSTWSPQSENVQVCEVLIDGQPIKRNDVSALLKLKTLDNSIGGMSPSRDINEAVLCPLTTGDAGPAVDIAQVTNLTAICKADGTLEWDVPAGTWKIVRLGYTLTVAMTSWSSPTGAGFESDPLDASAMDFQFANAAAPLIEDAGRLAGKVFKSVQIDSWEINHPNWTEKFCDQFMKFRGYDPKPYLPTLAGNIVGSPELTDRFLYDYRKTVGDLVAENYFGRLSTLAESKGIVQQSEAGGVCHPKIMAMDCLKNLGRCAIPMGEFWQDGTWVENNQNKNGKQTASAGHLYGKPVIAAEAFTSFIHWPDSPASLKPTADRAFCEGFNHFFIFSSATHSGDGYPGTEFCAGTHFNRKITWWSQAKCFSDYIARCSHMLQQGLFVGDVLFYNGDACPNFVPPKHIDPALGAGYDYDVCNTEIILDRLSVKNGKILAKGGMSYRLMVLPESKTMPIEVIKKIRQLVKDGATIIGPKPEKDPGLRDYPRCDAEVKTIADEVWGPHTAGIVDRKVGKGRVVHGIAAREILAQMGVKPDFTISNAKPDSFLDWIHRSTGKEEIYFIANRNNREEKAKCTFRVDGMQAELWDPVTGLSRILPDAEKTSDTCTSIQMEFGPHQSYFVVFKKVGTDRQAVRLAEGSGGSASPALPKNFPESRQIQELNGAWEVSFDAKWGPFDSAQGRRAGEFVFDKLQDWTTRQEEGIKYYSGTATYRKQFQISDLKSQVSGSKIYLDLGIVRNIARVKLNGKDLGAVWCSPWRVDISGAVNDGDNTLEIEVINLWPNRLIGDAALPVEKRVTRTNREDYKKESKLLESGLLGPVTIKIEAR